MWFSGFALTLLQKMLTFVGPPLEDRRVTVGDRRVTGVVAGSEKPCEVEGERGGGFMRLRITDADVEVAYVEAEAEGEA